MGEQQDPIEAFDWKRMLIHDYPWGFLGEVALRTLVMFVIILIALTISGKREVRQLSIFELILLIGLGSAAGDPMFYPDVALLPALVVFILMTALYRMLTYFIGKSKNLNELFEGKAVYIIEEGEFSVEKFDKEDLAIDEFFSELRVQGISHLGQVRTALLEPNGQISIFFYPDEEVKPGLPILPHDFRKKSDKLTKPGLYACTFCGNIEKVGDQHRLICDRCRNDTWVEAIDAKRVT